jgi:hypothetical protein
MKPDDGRDHIDSGQTSFGALIIAGDCRAILLAKKFSRRCWALYRASSSGRGTFRWLVAACRRFCQRSPVAGDSAHPPPRLSRQSPALRQPLATAHLLQPDHGPGVLSAARLRNARWLLGPGPPVAPALCGWARTMGASIIASALSASAASVLHTPSHTPRCLHRCPRCGPCFQAPQHSGRARHGLPARYRDHTASTHPRELGRSHLPSLCSPAIHQRSAATARPVQQSILPCLSPSMADAYCLASFRHMHLEDIRPLIDDTP